MGLFAPAWKSKNEEKALKAVEKETDQNKLTEISQNAPLDNVRKAADKKLNSVLINTIVDEVNYPWGLEKERINAVEKLSDPKMLISIVNKIENINVRKAAVKVLSDQSTLENIAKNDRCSDIREIAVNKLTAQSVLIDIAKYNRDANVRLIALKKLADQTEQAVYIHIARQDRNADVRLYAVSMISNLNEKIEIEKSMCAEGIHIWELINSESHDNYGTTDNYASKWSENTYKCKYCGKEKTISLD